MYYPPAQFRGVVIFKGSELKFHVSQSMPKSEHEK